MLGIVLTSPKLLSPNDYILFPDEECENAAKTKLMTPDGFYQINNNNSNNLFLHMNISSVSYYIDDLNTFIMNCKNKPKVIGISEYRIKTGRPPLSNINMNNYSYEYTPTESSKGGTLLYIDKNLRYRSRNDLTLYKSKEIESSFIEIIEPKKKNTIVGSIYKHPNVSVGEFTNDFLEPLLEKLCFEKKEVILMGDFNINLLNCNMDKSTSHYVDTLYSHAFFPKINSPTRITANSKTLIDNIFYNDVTKNIISGNITTSISDHLIQFLLIANQNPSSKNQVLNKRSLRNINSIAFEEDLKKINWNEALTLSEENPNLSFKTFLGIVDRLIDKHCPKKRIPKTKRQIKSKPWITPALSNSIEIKNRVYK